MNERRAIILVTDGGDNHSRYSLKETERFLEEADVPLFAVMAGPSLNFPFFSVPEEKSKTPVPAIIESLAHMAGRTGPDDFIGPAEIRGPHNLKVLTETTGGARFLTAGQLEDVQRIVETIRGSAVLAIPILLDTTLHSGEAQLIQKIRMVGTKCMSNSHRPKIIRVTCFSRNGDTTNRQPSATCVDGYCCRRTVGSVSRQHIDSNSAGIVPWNHQPDTRHPTHEPITCGLRAIQNE